MADIFFGGAKRDRTADLLLARQALSQLSYGPIIYPKNEVKVRSLCDCLSSAGFNDPESMGLSGLEPPTSPLSGVRSNQLS